jgi:hypothetical protein
MGRGAAWLRWLGVAVAAVLAVEAGLRAVRFGPGGVLHPLRSMPPAFGSRRCLQPGPEELPFPPGCRGWFRGVPVEINEAGLRDRGVDESRPHWRVAALGGSTTFGSGVAERDTYHARLEERWNAALGARDFVEFYNLGREWWTLSDEVHALEALQARQAPRRLDAVLPAVAPADPIFHVLGTRTCRPGDEGLLATPEERAFYDREVRGKNAGWAIFDRLEHWTGLWIMERAKTRLRHVARGDGLSAEGRRRLAALEARGVRLFRACAERLRERARGDGFELAWVAIWYRPDAKTTLLLRELAALGEPVVSMEDTWRVVAPEAPTVYPGDVHPSATLHGEYALRLDAFLAGLGWLDEARRSWDAARADSARP